MASFYIPGIILASLLLVGAKTAKGYADKFNFSIVNTTFGYVENNPAITLEAAITNPLPVAVNIQAINLKVMAQGVEVGTINQLPQNATLPAKQITTVLIPVKVSTGGILAQFLEGGVFSNTPGIKQLTITGTVTIHGFNIPVNYTMPLPQNLLQYAQN